MEPATSVAGYVALISPSRWAWPFKERTHFYSTARIAEGNRRWWDDERDARHWNSYSGVGTRIPLLKPLNNID